MSKRKNKVDLLNLTLSQKLIGLVSQLSKASYNPMADCYSTLGISEKASFAEVQQAYKQKLYKYYSYKEEFSKIKPGSATDICRTQILEKIKEAYRRICEFLQQDPQQGLVETKESLIKERDGLLKGWEGHKCGTPAISISKNTKNVSRCWRPIRITNNYMAADEDVSLPNN